MTINWQQFASSYDAQYSEEHRAISFPHSANSEKGTTISPLPYLSSISITGNDAAKLLQGQATCHMDLVNRENPASMGALCTNKGRVYSLFRCITLAESDSPTYLLFMHHSLAALTLAKLAKYAVFYKAKLQDTASDWVNFGLQGEQARLILDAVGLPVPSQAGSSLQHNNITVTCTSHPRCQRFQLSLHSEHVDEIWQKIINAGATASDTSTWQQQDIQAGLPWLTEDCVELFLPQMLNLQTPTLSAISFSKGCYTGQEIVARTKYLGKLKRRLFIAEFSTPCEIQPGTELFSASRSSAIGTVVNRVQHADGTCTALVVLKIDQQHQQDIHLEGTENIQVALSEVPYEIIDVE